MRDMNTVDVMVYTNEYMAVLKIIERFYQRESEAYVHLVQHGMAVGNKALRIAAKVTHLHPDLVFIEEAALLHDIGMIKTNVPQLGCFGEHPYIAHGYLGRAMLEEAGLTRHALVCERHVGTGLTAYDIETNRFPLPLRDMTPQTIEEQIICFADKFFSKDDHSAEKSIMVVRKQIARYGAAQLRIFDNWTILFGESV